MIIINFLIEDICFIWECQTNDYASRQTKIYQVCLHLTGSLVGPGDMLIIPEMTAVC